MATTPKGDYIAYAILRKSADQTISNNTVTDVTFDTEDVDSGGIHTGSNATVSLSEGLYIIIAIISWGANSTGDRLVKITDGGGSDIAFMQSSIEGSSASERQALPIIWLVPAGGQTYKIRVIQTSGGNLSVLGVRSSYFMIAQLA